MNNKRRLLDNFYDKETNTYYTIQMSDLNINKKNLLKWHNAGYTGKGIRGAVLDTGILTHHPMLMNNIKGSIDFTGEGIEDFNGHGTMVALMDLSCAPDSELLNVKVLNRYKAGFEEDIVKGLRWAVENGAIIINMSLGIEREKRCPGTCIICTEIEKIVREYNVSIITCVGNKPDKHCCPAESKYVLTFTDIASSFKNPIVAKDKKVIVMDNSYNLIPMQKLD